MVRYQIRLPEEILDEAKALVDGMNQDSQLTIRGKVVLADVLRLALREGLATLRQRYITEPQKRKEG
jgi:hypothetical protein